MGGSFKDIKSVYKDLVQLLQAVVIGGDEGGDVVGICFGFGRKGFGLGKTDLVLDKVGRVSPVLEGFG